MRISFVSLFYPDDAASPRDHLRRYPIHQRLPEEMAARGHDVQFVQLFPEPTSFRAGRVTYRFVPPARSSRVLARLAAAASGRPRALFEASPAAVSALREFAPDVVHVHGTQLHFGLMHLRRGLGRASLVLHYHGGSPPRRRMIRRVQRRNLRRANAVLFTALEQAEPFYDAGALVHRDAAHQLVETSSVFSPTSGIRMLSGEPVFLSACRLDPIKDPLTTLKGFELILDDYPSAELHHFFRADGLLADLRSYIRGRPRLRSKVHFHGALPYADMQQVFSSADVLLQASRREFSGCAVLDAMACGVVPVVSDLPPLRMIVGDAGVLFRPGSPEALALAVRSIADVPKRKICCRQRFVRCLSFPAMAARLEIIYQTSRACRA